MIFKERWAVPTLPAINKVVNNMSILELTKQEEQLVKDVLLVDTNYYRDLDDVITDWINFISEIEAGYGFSFEEYINDLLIRDIIETVMNKVPSIKNKLYKIVKPIDEKYINATHEVDFMAIDEPYFWNRRLPNIIEGELLDSLNAYGKLKKKG